MFSIPDSLQVDLDNISVKYLRLISVVASRKLFINHIQP